MRGQPKAPGPGSLPQAPGPQPSFGFGVVTSDAELDAALEEPRAVLRMLEALGVRWICITAGSPYYNPHIQRPALYPPSDGYQPPEDPLIGVAGQMKVTRQLKQSFPELIVVGTAYSYLQDFLPHVAQASVREGWVDAVGLGRMVLAYPELLRDAVEGKTIEHKRICRTFSDCTTAPRKGLPSGCYPLDGYYKNTELAERLKSAKAKR